MLKKLLILFSFLLTLTLISCGEDLREKQNREARAMQETQDFKNQQATNNTIAEVTRELQPYRIKDLSNLNNVLLEKIDAVSRNLIIKCGNNFISSLSGLSYCSGGGIT